MMKKLAIAVVTLMLLAPTLGLVTVGLVMNPAGNYSVSLRQV